MKKLNPNSPPSEVQNVVGPLKTIEADKIDPTEREDFLNL